MTDDPKSPGEVLKACPFCGSDGEELGLCYETGETPALGADWFVRCYVCHVETERMDTSHEAIAAWNRRATSADKACIAELEEGLRGLLKLIDREAKTFFECEECGHHLNHIGDYIDLFSMVEPFRLLAPAGGEDHG